MITCTLRVQLFYQSCLPLKIINGKCIFVSDCFDELFLERCVDAVMWNIWNAPGNEMNFVMQLNLAFI